MRDITMEGSELGLKSTILQLIEHKRTTEGMTFREAIRMVESEMESFVPDIGKTISEIIESTETNISTVIKMSEDSTSFARTPQNGSWYSRQMLRGGVWEALQTQMYSSSLSDAVESIDEASDSVMAHTAEPHVVGDRRRGLVIGNVQSGKTANYAAVIAKAVDEGYRLIIVLAGMYQNLRIQTQQRLERDLGIESGNSHWFRLTGTTGDIGPDMAKNASSMLSSNHPTLAVVKKNSHRLAYLRDFLKSIDRRTMERTPIMIIDDESDQATPDASGEGSNSPTAINSRVREIWNLVKNGSYIAYTATPFANVFMNPDDEGELYPSDFINVMPTPKTYFGAERLFGVNEPEPDRTGPDVIRKIKDYELINIAPRGRAEVQNFQPKVTESLDASIRWFIIGVALRRLRGQGDQHSTMLVHTTHRVDPHFRLRDTITVFLDELRERALNQDVTAFYNNFLAEINKAAELYAGDKAPFWSEVAEEIPKVLRTIKVVVDNAGVDESKRLNYKTEKPQTVIVIGGGTLSRGLTLEGLFVSLFARSSNTYDTLLQMGRWFGYRPGYEDLQRIWVSSGLDSHYRFLAEVESDLRIDVNRMRASNQTPREIGLRVKQHPGRLQITSKNKMKHTNEVEVDCEGLRLQTTALKIKSFEELNENSSRVEDFLANLFEYEYSGYTDRQSQPILFRDVPAGQVLEFLSDLQVHDRYRELLDDMIEWTNEKLPTTPWNVVVASGNGHECYKVGERSVTKVTRTVQGAKLVGVSSEIEVRAMRTGGDLIADLRILRSTNSASPTKISTEDQLRLRMEDGAIKGRGLLVLYPLSPSSGVKRDSNNEQPYATLNDLTSEIDPRLASNESPHLFGISTVAPFDIKNEIKDKGTFVAVRPQFFDDDEDDLALQALPEDNESDYRSEDL